MIVNEDQEKLNIAMSSLMVNHSITPQMASSLMNDSSYAFHISLNLVAAARILFVARDSDASQAMDDALELRHELDLNDIGTPPNAASPFRNNGGEA